MKNSWRQLLRRLAAGCVVSVSVAWSSAMCYAVQLAFDSASDPVYNDGWQGIKHATNGTQVSTGDNGGFGFTPWNFDAGYKWQGTLYAYDHPGFHAIDDGLKTGTHYSNPFNDIGRSWAVGSPSNSDGAPRYGRGFSPLQVGETISVTVDNPTQRKYYNGYFIQLNGNTGGVNGNICRGQGGVSTSCSPGGTGVNKLTLWRFENFNYGIWKLGDGAGDIDTTLYDTDTAAAGMRFDVTRTGTDTYDLTVTPLGTNPAAPPYTHSGTFRNPGTPVDWFSIVFFNLPTDIGTPPIPSDYNLNGYVDAADYVIWRKTAGTETQFSNWKATFSNAATPTTATDLYIRSMSISNGSGTGLGQGAVPEPGTGTLLVLAVGTLLGCGTARRRH